MGPAAAHTPLCYTYSSSAPSLLSQPDNNIIAGHLPQNEQRSNKRRRQRQAKYAALSPFVICKSKLGLGWPHCASGSGSGNIVAATCPVFDGRDKVRVPRKGPADHLPLLAAHRQLRLLRSEMPQQQQQQEQQLRLAVEL